MTSAATPKRKWETVTINSVVLDVCPHEIYPNIRYVVGGIHVRDVVCLQCGTRIDPALFVASTEVEEKRRAAEMSAKLAKQHEFISGHGLNCHGQPATPVNSSEVLQAAD